MSKHAAARARVNAAVEAVQQGVLVKVAAEQFGMQSTYLYRQLRERKLSLPKRQKKSDLLRPRKRSSRPNPRPKASLSQQLEREQRRTISRIWIRQMRPRVQAEVDARPISPIRKAAILAVCDSIVRVVQLNPTETTRETAQRLYDTVMVFAGRNQPPVDESWAESLLRKK